jgi:peptidoglycan/xylan/chitin deacetylase (PgdA/CDA1 family)
MKLERNTIRKVMLTFDTEDNISPNALVTLKTLLCVLEKTNVQALFFITGHMAERLSTSPELVKMLSNHEIGYHSSSHSTHPTIFEFTDIENYDQAYQISKQRETSHINPLTGEPEGPGGLLALKSLFPSKEIISFRAPGNCWSPPHLEALRDLGIKMDFSSSIYPMPFKHKGITFYPYPNLGDWINKNSYYRLMLLSILRNEVTVADLHPSFFLNQKDWDSIYWEKNPSQLVAPLERNPEEIETLFVTFEKFLKRMKQLKKIGIFEFTAKQYESQNELPVTNQIVEECYNHSMRWPKKLFNYEPKFLKKLFFTFFGIDQ